MANTLYEYYTGKGQTLPSIQERSKLYQQYGLGQAGTYGGTAEQNTALLQKLIGQGGGTSVVPGVGQSGTGAYTYNQKSYATGTGPLASQAPPTPVEPKPYESQTTTGQSTLKALSDAGYKVDEVSLKQMYRDWGFEDTYGAFTGSTPQYNAIRQKAVEETQNKLTSYQQAVKNAEQAGYGTGQDVPSSVLSGGEVNASYKYAPMSGEDYTKVMDNIVSTIGSTDLTKLISDFAGGTLTTPELELTKEDKDAKLEEIKSAATQGLATIQKGLAAKGMTFSGIRTEAEANLAADTLAKESGINREFAGKIISAARQEQSRRETALQTAETNYNKALEALGYQYNMFTDTIEPTMERQRFEADQDKVTEPTTQMVGGNLYTYDGTTGQWNLTIAGEKKETSPLVKSGGLVIAESNIAAAQAQLDSKRGSDGYADTGVYLSLLKDWKNQGGLEQDFFDEFPPANYLRYGDPTIPQYIKDKYLKKPEAEETNTADLQKAVKELNKPWWEFWR